MRLLAQDPPARAGGGAHRARPPRRGRCRAAGSPRSWPATADDGAPGEALLDSIAGRLARRLGEGAIGAEAFGAAIVFVPDPDAPGRRRRLEAAVDDRPAALGPTVDWQHATTSARRAIATQRLPRRASCRAGRPGGLLVADDHLADLLLAADPLVAADLAARGSRRSPSSPTGPRARLSETLAAWLDRPGQVQAVAAALGVHPQTVRYRVRQLRDLFGERLEDPDARFELSLALRVR